MLTLGYKASAEQFGPRELLDFAIQAEQTGFDSVFVSDHYQPWRHTTAMPRTASPGSVPLAARTERVAIGTSVLTPTFRYHPAIVAQAMATIGCLAEGRRVILGVGTGESLNEVPLGIEWPDQKERFARLKEATELIRRLWSEEFVTFDGEYLQDPQRDRLRPTEGSRRAVDRGIRSGGGPARRAGRRRLHLHVGQGHGALRRDAPAGGRRGRREGRAGRPTRSRR